MSQTQLSTSPPPLVSMQFATLLQLGIDICQALGGDNWTDYNEHDPGVTMLEQLSYAITDLGYRVNYPVADILAETQDSARPEQGGLFTGDAILCCDPITMVDFRKLVCDRARLKKLSNFKNIWLQAAGQKASQRAGVLTARIETWNGQDDPNLIKEVGAILQQHRVLGEDFGTIQVAPLFDARVEATLTIEPTATPEAVLADALYQLQDALVPFIQFASVDQMMQQGIAPDDIYLGPRLSQGVLADDQFLALPKTLSLTGLNAQLLGVDGVTACSDMRINGIANGGISVPAGTVPRLQPCIFMTQTAWPIKIVRNGRPVTVDAARVTALIAQRVAANASAHCYAPQTSESEAYNAPAPGQLRDIAVYYSLQRQFPQTYGIGAYGVELRQTLSPLSLAERSLRLSQAKQLKAYLLFFEQILTNGFAQLANAPRLLSLDRRLDRSYFWQPLVPLGTALQKRYPWQKSIDSTMAPPNVLEWRVLRSAETTPAPGTPPSSDDRCYAVNVVIKNPPQRVLRSAEYRSLLEVERARDQILQLGQEADNYRLRTLPNDEVQLLLAESDSQVLGFGVQRYIDGLEAGREMRRLAAWMRNLAGNANQRARYMTIVMRGTLGLELIDAQGQILLSARDLTRDEQNQRVTAWLQHGIHAQYYVVRSADGDGHRILLRNRGGSVIGRGIEVFDSAADAEAAIDQLVKLFQELCCNDAAQLRHIVRLPKPVPPQPQPKLAVEFYAQGVDQLTRQFDPFLQRRNQFLTHVLGRFNETWADTQLIAFDPRHGVHKEQVERDLISTKIDFLQRYPQARPNEPDSTLALGAGRSRARDYTHERSAVSGLEQRLKLLLDIGSAKHRDPGKGDGKPPAADGEWAYFSFDADDIAGAVDHGLKGGENFVFASDDPAIFQALLRDGIVASNYSLGTSRPDGSVSVSFSWSDGSAPREVFRAPTAAAARSAIDALVSQLHALMHDADGIHAYEELVVVEHLLLRPLQAGASSPVPAEFFQYRISAMLPSWAARFQHPGFRHLTEQLLAQNCPGHLQADCHWLDRQAMKRFRQLHGRWSTLKSGAAPDLTQLDQAAAELAEFIYKLEPEYAT